MADRRSAVEIKKRIKMLEKCLRRKGMEMDHLVQFCIALGELEWALGDRSINDDLGPRIYARKYKKYYQAARRLASSPMGRGLSAR